MRNPAATFGLAVTPGQPSEAALGHTCYSNLLVIQDVIHGLMFYSIWLLVGYLFLFTNRKVLKETSVGDLKPNETVEANLEAQLLSRLDHPAIVKFYTSFVEGESFCIITEYCEVRPWCYFFSRELPNESSKEVV